MPTGVICYKTYTQINEHWESCRLANHSKPLVNVTKSLT